MINRRIRTEEEYKAALVEIERFFEHEPDEGTPEADRVDLLALLIKSYEDKHHPIGPPHPVEMIRHRMRTAGYRQADLSKLLGSRARASEVLQRKRRRTLPMIWKLSRAWKIAADTLVTPYKLVSERRRRRPTGAKHRKGA